MLSEAVRKQLERMDDDHRIGPLHLSLYLCMLRHAEQCCPALPISFFSHELMRLSKIGGRATYRRLLKDLQDGGYIRYEPSFNRFERSAFFVII